MKIGIITQPLAENYGGILQNYALQRLLVALGHEVYTINRCEWFLPYYLEGRSRVFWQIRQLVKRCVRKKKFASRGQFHFCRQHCEEFVMNNIRLTEEINNQEQLLKLVDKYKFEVYLVGSDQVWRPCYSKNIYNDFLEFCQKAMDVKRIAYAASFGVDNWEFDDSQTNKCRCLAKKFDAISVREDSGVGLCKRFLDVEAVHVLDPTMVLEKDDYIKLLEQYGERKHEGDMFCYILDNDDAIRKIICDIEMKYSLRSFQVKTRKDFRSIISGDNLEDYIIPSPTKWLRAFVDAKVVFTDSFHGCVFSIIFNKPFWVIGNERRGNARFDSLLRMFKLENRRISIDEINNSDLMNGIDWEDVNNILAQKREEAFRFLNQALQS